MHYLSLRKKIHKDIKISSTPIDHVLGEFGNTELEYFTSNYSQNSFEFLLNMIFEKETVKIKTFWALLAFENGLSEISEFLSEKYFEDRTYHKNKYETNPFIELGSYYFSLVKEFKRKETSNLIQIANSFNNEKLHDKAHMFYKRAADLGNLGGQIKTAINFANGIGTEKDINQANKYYELAENSDINSIKKLADKGDIYCQLIYAQHLKKLYTNKGIEFTNDVYKDVFSYTLKSATQGNHKAMQILGELYVVGIGVKQNIEIGLEYYRKSADMGIKEAQFNYAFLLFQDFDGKRQIELAEEYAYKSAQQGFTEALILLEIIKKDKYKIESKKENTIKNEPENTIEIENEPENTNEYIEIKFPPLLENTVEIKTENTKNNLPIQKLKIKKSKIYKRKSEIKNNKLNTTEQNTVSISKVDVETLNFVDAVFSRNGQKFSSFSVKDAIKAFKNLGCTHSEKNGCQYFEFTLVNENIIKYKFHNIHGEKSNKMPNDLRLKLFMKRFLESINKTPDTLI